MKYFIYFRRVFLEVPILLYGSAYIFSPGLGKKNQTCYVFVYRTVEFFSELLIKKS